MPRHRTLRAVVEWSWDLLAPAERVLVERLAVFASGATVDSAIAVCADERDVASCVDWARRYGVRPVARGGGHSFAGFSTTRGLLIDLGRLNAVRVDQARGTMTLGGGTRNGDLFKSIKGGHLFLPIGTCLGVGAGGVTLGLGAAIAASRVIEHLLYGVSRYDPLSFAGGALLLLVVGVLACVVPTLRASAVDPVTAMRAE